MWFLRSYSTTCLIIIITLVAQLTCQQEIDLTPSYAKPTNNPKVYNIGAILSEPQQIMAFVNEIEQANNDSMPEGVTLAAKALQMASHPIQVAKDVCAKLISSGVYAVIVSHSMNGSDVPSSISFTCGFYHIPVIGISNRASSLSNKNIHSSFLRTIPPYSHEADVWIELLLYLDYKSVIIIHSSDSDGRATLDRFQTKADKANIHIMSVIEYESGISNITQGLQQVRKDFYCRVFLLYANWLDAITIFDEVRRQEMDQSDFVWIISEQALSAPNIPSGVLSPKLKLSEEIVLIKDSVGVLTNALREMYFSHNITNPPGDCHLASSQKWATGPLFYRNLIRQQYNGRSGRIAFDEYGDRLFSEYEIMNVVNNTQVNVGKYSFSLSETKMKLSLLMHKIKWPGNHAQKPLGYHVPKHLKIVTLVEKPFVWAYPSKGASRECFPNQTKCFKVTYLLNDDQTPSLEEKEYDENYFDLPLMSSMPSSPVKVMPNISTPQTKVILRNETYCCQGYCIDLLKNMSARLNFTYELELVSDSKYGTLEFVGNERIWTGLVGELVYKRADMAVAPLTANPERSQVIAFSKPFKYEGINILQRRQPRKATLASFLQPFDDKLWVLVMISVHVVAMALYLLDRFSPFGGFKMKNSVPSDEPPLEFSDSIWFSWGVLLNSGIGERTPRSFSARVLGMVWAGFAMIVVASYTANLTAYLVLNPRDEHTLTGIEDLRLRNPTESFSFATVKGSAVEMFFRSQVHLFNAYRTMEETNMNSPEEALDAVKKGELDAFIWDSPRLEYEAAQDCELIIAGEMFGRSGYGIGLQKDSFWIDKVTLAMLRMHESGYMESLDNKWILNNNDKLCELEQFPYTLGMKNLAGVFILVFFGIIISFGLIVIEIIYKKRKARRVRRYSIAKKIAFRWLYKVKRQKIESELGPTGKPVFTIIRNADAEDGIPVELSVPLGKNSPSEESCPSFPIPPPPPPPRMLPPHLMAFQTTAALSTQQRTAQQKIYEFKHRKSLGYY